MRCTRKALVCLGVAGLGLLGALYLFPSCEGSGGLLDLAYEFPEIAKKEGELNDQRRVFLKCKADKEAIIPEVIEQRMSLLKAAARFREIDGKNPLFQKAAFIQGHAGRSDIERYCHAVIGDVRAYLLDRPERAEEEGRRLEAELEDVTQSGALHLAELEAPDMP
jgi:hypothetical protein